MKYYLSRLNGIYIVFLFLLFVSFTPPQKTWVAIGDSITYLNDHTDETDHRITKGYMTLVTKKLPNIQFINQGHNGWTSGGIADKIETLGIQKAEIYSIFLGTNDWWAGRSIGTLDDYKNNTGNSTVNGSFRIIMNKLRSLNPTAKIILITPMQRVDFVYLFGYTNNAYGSYKAKNGQMLSEFADVIKSIGIYENIDVVDLYNVKSLRMAKLVKYKRLKDPVSSVYKNFKYPDFIDIPFDPKKDEYPYPLGSINMTYDGLHPSDKGYKVIADALVKLLR